MVGTRIIDEPREVVFNELLTSQHSRRVLRDIRTFADCGIPSHGKNRYVVCVIFVADSQQDWFGPRRLLAVLYDIDPSR